MDRLAPRAYRYPAIALLGAVLAAAAPRSCEETCDLCTADNQPRWPALRTCLTGADAAACDGPCELCMRQVSKAVSPNCSYSWNEDCAKHAAARCNLPCANAP